VLLAALALLVPIRAYEPLILFGMTSVLLVAGWGAGRMWRTMSRKAHEEKAAKIVPRFRLQDVLLACAVAGAASWMISVLVAKSVTVDWSRAAGTAALLATVSSLAVCVIAFRGWWRLPLLAAGMAAAAVVDALVLDGWWEQAEMIDEYDPRRWPIPARYLIFSYIILYGMFAVPALAITALALGATRRWKRPLWSIAFRGTAIALTAAAGIFLAWVYWRMLDVPEWSPGSPNRPNALPRVFELARATKQATPQEADAIYAELFELLDQPSYVVWPTVRPSAHELNADGELSIPRNLTRGLQTRINALTAQDRYDEAADLCLAVVRLAPMLDREGTAIHRWESEAVIHMGHAWLARVREKLSPAKSREAAELILRSAASREPLEATNLRDDIWNNRIAWRDMLKRTILLELQSDAYLRPNSGFADDIALRNQCLARLLALDLLIRAHRREFGKFPATLQEVALSSYPDLLVDPLSDGAFVYQRTESGLLLYSVGENGVDNGGRFTNGGQYLDPSTRKTHDLDVDTMTRP
jgi:hypothetical protein